MDWIAFWIAIIGFVISIFNFVENRIAHARRLDVHVKYCIKEAGVLLVVMEFVNKSRLAISITSGVIESLGERHPFGETSSVAFVYENPAKSGKGTERTCRFPINVEPLSAIRVLVQTEKWEGNLPKACNIQLGTSRGPIRKEVEFPTGLADWKAMLKRLK